MAANYLSFQDLVQSCRLDLDEARRLEVNEITVSGSGPRTTTVSFEEMSYTTVEAPPSKRGYKHPWQHANWR